MCGLFESRSIVLKSLVPTGSRPGMGRLQGRHLWGAQWRQGGAQLVSVAPQSWASVRFASQSPGQHTRKPQTASGGRGAGRKERHP